LTSVFNFRKPDISTRRQCLAASGGYQRPASEALQGFVALGRVVGLTGGAAGGAGPALPAKPVDVATLSTLALLLTPRLRVVLDPLLFLQQRARGHLGATNLGGPDGSGNNAASSSSSFPRLIHMTLRSKREVAPHQVCCD
jgi:hypothetical protein